MTSITDKNEQFTGLILLTGLDKPGIASALFESLSPFSISIIDIEQLVISDRLILTVLIVLNPAHQKAIEDDLEQCAKKIDVDIATLFTSRINTPPKEQLVDVVVTSEKVHPRTIAEISSIIQSIDANIEAVNRLSMNPLTLCFTISGANLEKGLEVLTSKAFDDGSKIAVKVHV